MGKEDTRLDKIRAALSPHGIFLRGVLNFDGDGPEMAGGRAQTVILLGNVGGSIWPAFSHWRAGHPGSPDPLDAWSVEVVRPVAEALGGTAWFPSERPWQPFQQWAMRAEGLKPSPLGILMHPRYGLWHAYRGALLFEEEIEIPDAGPKVHLCDTCAGKPCLKACPVGAYSVSGFDHAGCLSHVRGGQGGPCRSGGCLDRNACPYGTEWRYRLEAQAFHMAAFARL